MCTMMLDSFTLGRGHQGTWPGASIGSASECAPPARNELITRVPHRNRYTLTPDGLRFAVFYTKVHDRLLRPLITADQPQAPPELRDALRAIDRHLSQRIAVAGLPAAA